MRFLLLIVLAFCCSFVHAKDKYLCKLSKSIVDNYEPKVFNKTNNLLNSPDKNPTSCSDRLIIKGKVIDQNCNPVSDAKVEVWQVGCNGRYSYAPLRTQVDKNLFTKKSQDNFLGSGTAITNEAGEFNFITIKPTAKTKLKYLNVRIKHKDTKELQTRLRLDKIKDTNSQYFELVVLRK